eukprot:2585415-Rhodomonas_salina.1
MKSLSLCPEEVVRGIGGEKLGARGIRELRLDAARSSVHFNGVQTPQDEVVRDQIVHRRQVRRVVLPVPPLDLSHKEPLATNINDSILDSFFPRGDDLGNAPRI